MNNITNRRWLANDDNGNIDSDKNSNDGDDINNFL